MAGRRLIAGLFLVLVSFAHAAGWETLTDCHLAKNRWNDGDSFHVKHAGREFIFRLCYVDAPETSTRKGQAPRTTAQAKYWKIQKKDMFVVAREAAQDTQSLLAPGFTVKTQWQDARGESSLPRYFAIVSTTQGDLAELLVRHGYARIYGYAPPDADKSDYRKKLRALEARARSEKAGAWAFPHRRTKISR